MWLGQPVHMHSLCLTIVYDEVCVCVWFASLPIIYLFYPFFLFYTWEYRLAYEYRYAVIPSQSFERCAVLCCIVLSACIPCHMYIHSIINVCVCMGLSMCVSYIYYM